MKSKRHTYHPLQSARWLRAGRWCLAGLYFTFFIIHSSRTNGQTRDQLTGTWIGVHTELDIDFTCPLPTYIQLDTDSTYHLGMVDGSASALKSTWAVDEERVRLDTIHFAPRLVTVQNNLLRIGATFPMVFRRFTDVPIDSASTYQQLAGRVWQSDNLTVALYANGQVSLESTLSKQRTAHFWRLATFGQSVFLVIFGNQHNREGGYKPSWQIASLLPNQLQAIGWNGCTVATETFRFVRHLAQDELCRASGFQTCDNCFQPLWREAPLSRSSKRYDINQLVARQYQPIVQAGQSGLIRIQLVVNCEGEQGLLTLDGFGEDYCPKTFDGRITKQLQEICQNQIATDPTLRRSDLSGQTFDVTVALTFRLKDGRITDILP